MCVCVGEIPVIISRKNSWKSEEEKGTQKHKGSVSEERMDNFLEGTNKQ